MYQIVAIGAGSKVTLQRVDVYRILALVAFVQANPDADPRLAAVNDALPGLQNPRVSVPSPSANIPTRPPPPQQIPSGISPWDTAPRYAIPPTDANGASATAPLNGGNPEAEAERGYWRRLETVEVSLIPEKESWFLRKYRLVSDRRGDVLSRRYSDFIWLHQTLLARYVSLPGLLPKLTTAVPPPAFSTSQAPES